jgi:hypothetical protein
MRRLSFCRFAHVAFYRPFAAGTEKWLKLDAHRTSKVEQSIAALEVFRRQQEKIWGGGKHGESEIYRL